MDGIVETASELWEYCQAWQDTWNNHYWQFYHPIISLDFDGSFEAGCVINYRAGAQILVVGRNISIYIIQPIQEAYDWVSRQIVWISSWLKVRNGKLPRLLPQVAWVYLNNILLPVQRSMELGLKNRLAKLVSWLHSQCGDREIIYFLQRVNLF